MKMTLEEIINVICPTDAIHDCCEGEKNCSECECYLREILTEYALKVREDAIDDLVDALGKEVMFSYKELNYSKVEEIADRLKGRRNENIPYVQKMS